MTAPTNVPLVIDDLDALIANPLGALGSYFTRCLNTRDNINQPLIQHLLPEFARVLGTSTGSASTESGSGTPNDPWQIQLANISGNNADSNLVAYLQLWQPLPAGNDLQFAIKLTSPLPLSEVTANLEVLVELLHLTLPAMDGSGAFGADWLGGVSARLRGHIRQSIQTQNCSRYLGLAPLLPNPASRRARRELPSPRADLGHAGVSRAMPDAAARVPRQV